MASASLVCILVFTEKSRLILREDSRPQSTIRDSHGTKGTWIRDSGAIHNPLETVFSNQYHGVLYSYSCIKHRF